MDPADDNSISVRAKVLRDEIRMILKQERLYHERNQHSAAEKMAYASRKLRLAIITAELKTHNETE
jgi:hypothetical protein